MKRKIWGLTLFLLGSFFSLQAQNVSSLSWGQVCSGKMGSEWYGSEEAQKIADDVIYVQRTSGGWMKNEDLHKLTPAKRQTLYNERNKQSCLDNSATTMEMRFLAKVYQKTGIEKIQNRFSQSIEYDFHRRKDAWRLVSILPPIKQWQLS